jgi:hypothetical protein
LDTTSEDKHPELTTVVTYQISQKFLGQDHILARNLFESEKETVRILMGPGLNPLARHEKRCRLEQIFQEGGSMLQNWRALMGGKIIGRSLAEFSAECVDLLFHSFVGHVSLHLDKPAPPP